MEPRKHPERFDSAKAPNELNNSTIDAAKALQSALRLVGFNAGLVGIDVPNEPEYVPVADALKEGVSPRAELNLYLDQIEGDPNGDINVGTANEMIRLSLHEATPNIVFGIGRAINQKFTAEQIIANFVQQDPEVKKLVETKLAAEFQKALDAEAQMV